MRDRTVPTERELDCLRLVADGLTFPAVAERLILSPETVKKHMTSLYNRWGVATAAQAVATGFRLGRLR